MLEKILHLINAFYYLCFVVVLEYFNLQQILVF